jgi:hypothetical protein
VAPEMIIISHKKKKKCFRYQIDPVLNKRPAAARQWHGKHAVIKHGAIAMQCPVNNDYDAVFSMWSMQSNPRSYKEDQDE